ncbi:hypothetical protein AD006_28665 (plasmid) [Pseudonocardia sp. EC080610-09]|uniref:hypothetical protein n=1 Tax=unclassified Pseudonocardia TaxID=2619320 RepID=UPI000705BDCA|nr:MULTISPECIES: hypothetical protein [unclassified Pseudonocardia]ALL79293.1 hypothetical protein AD006_28665 [Pseudonocardia sp. EC080610-09]ALL85263.1 hypothetical protein AD017_29055 [Pseudonocardia sp. EC080619-01]
MSADLITTARNTSLGELAAILEAQQTRKHDVVVPAAALRCHQGALHLPEGHTRLSYSGVTRTDAVLAPTRLAENGVAAKLDIPVAYLRRLRAHDLDLYDANINGWLAHQPRRRFLLRSLIDDDGHGTLRAMLSDSYAPVDNLDVLTSVLAGMTAAGAAVDIAQADLTESRMYVKIRSREIAAMAPRLLGNYVSPFTGARGADNPVVFAGFVVSNSETGHGKFAITPQLTVQICDNGMTIPHHAHTKIHLGGKLPDGEIRWSHDTQQHAMALVHKRARDAVATFLSEDFLTQRLTEIENEATTAITDPAPVIEHVGASLQFSETARSAIMARFVQGADLSSGGVLHAVTAAAQDLDDADESHELEAAGLRAMSTAAAFVRRRC